MMQRPQYRRYSATSSIALRATAGLLLSTCAGGTTCQLYADEGTPLQDLLQVECSISKQVCSCKSNMWGNYHPEWHVITPTVRPGMAKNNTPGSWYLTDKEGKCGASFSGGSAPELLSCPPAFYCEGGLHNPEVCGAGDHCPGGAPKHPRQCPAGYFCPFPAAPKQDCMDGALCLRGSLRPKACKAGSYCRAGMQHQCPKGHYCPMACVSPVKCNRFMLCPAGSTHENSAPIAFALVFVVIIMLIGGARYYYVFLRSSLSVCVVLGFGIAMLWFVDVVVAAFMTVNFVAITSNYLLERFCKCPPIAAQGLLNATCAVAIILVYGMHPAWAMMLGGLWLCFGVGWLMSYEDFKWRLAGRSCLVLLFAALVFEYWNFDPDFLYTYTFCVAGVSVYYILVWASTECLSLGDQAMPFASRWRIDGDRIEEPRDNTLSEPTELSASFGIFSPLDDGVEAGRAGPLLSNVPTVGSSSPGDGERFRHGHDTDARIDATNVADKVKGVSFLLQGVAFSLRDGSKLLKDINLGVLPGRRCAVMGPSGSGKSTLLAVLSGRASYGVVTGSMHVGGHKAKDPGLLRHVTGYVPQDDLLHGELTVEENVRFQARLRLPATMAGEEHDEAVNRVIQDLHLHTIRDSRVGTAEIRGVSGGQRKRVSIAMELVIQPLLLFADEPTSGLDSTTSHDVVGCMNKSAASIGTTVLCVIHQPRYETLRLFDDLVLLAVGGSLVYSGPVEIAKKSFEDHLQVTFPAHANPADTILDAIQAAEHFPTGCVAALQSCGFTESCIALPPARTVQFHRDVVSFFKAVLIFMDRAMLQTMRSYAAIIINQILCMMVVLVLTFIMPNVDLVRFLFQSNLASLFLMLLQGVAAQRIFGEELLVTLREAGVGVCSTAYVVAKDLATFFEITLSAAVFAATWGTLSGVQQPIVGIFAGTWSFIYSVYGFGYIFSICMSPASAQMAMVVAAFLSFCVSGVYQPLLPDMVSMLGGRGWIVPALSSVRWFSGYLLTMEMKYLTPLAKLYGGDALKDRGYDIKYLEHCSLEGLPYTNGVVSLHDAWTARRGWVCSSVDMLFLGILFRFVAGICLIFYINAHTLQMARFFGQSEKKGARKLFGKLFRVLVGAFMMLIFVCEMWLFSIRSVDVKAFLAYLVKPGEP